MTRTTADLLLLLATLIWGLAFVWQQTAMAHMGPLTLTGARFLIAAAVVLPFAWRERKRGPAIPRPQMGFVAGIGVIFFLTVTVQQLGLIRTTVTNSGFLTALYVVMVPALSVLARRHRLHPVIWPAAALSLVGTFLLGGGQLGGLNRGDGLIIVSAFLGALQIMGGGLLVETLGRPVAIAFSQFLVTGVLGLGLALWFEAPSFAGAAAAWRELAYTGVLSGGVGFTLQAIAQAHTPPADTAIIVSMESVVAAISGAVILGEKMSFSGWMGAGLIMTAALVVQLVPIYARRFGTDASRARALE